MAAAERRLRAGTPKKKITPLHERRNIDPDYFTWPSPFWMTLILFGIWLLVTSTLSPASIPSFFGPIATFGKYMGTTYPNVCIYLCAFTLIVHILQAAFAGKVCHDRGMKTSTTIKWVLSTFLFGFSSLILRLLPNKPGVKRA